MDAPPIRYARTDDGVDIGYAVIGAGRPTVVAERALFAGVDFSTRSELHMQRYGPLAIDRALVLFDWRGLGTSGDAGDYSLDAFERDLAAVIEAVAAPHVDLVGLASPGHAAASYAAKHPQRVRRFAWMFAGPPGGSPRTDPRFGPIMSLADENWPVFVELFALLGWGFTDSETARHLHARLRSRFTPELFNRLVTALEAFDATPVAPQLTMPCLVHSVDTLEPAQVRWVRQFAAALPNGRHLLAERNPLDPEAWVRAAVAFLDEDTRPDHQPGGFRTMLFTDLAASTATTQRLGDAAAQDLVRAHNDIVRTALSTHAGHEIKHTGDGIMAWFPAASNALDCAQAIQQSVAELTNPDLGVKIGVNAGEPIAEEDDLYGTAVQIAARVTDQAGPGEIVCTNVVRELVAGKGYLFSEREPAALKGVEEPVRLFVVREGA